MYRSNKFFICVIALNRALSAWTSHSVLLATADKGISLRRASIIHTARNTSQVGSLPTSAAPRQKLEASRSWRVRVASRFADISGLRILQVLRNLRVSGVCTTATHRPKHLRAAVTATLVYLSHGENSERVRQSCQHLRGLDSD
jgi:hypothetical protein